MKTQDHDVVFSSKSIYWETPRNLFDALNAEYQFDVDIAASNRSHMLPRYFTPEQDAFKQILSGLSVWCNPPYDNQTAWLELCETAKVACFLIPARTGRLDWHSHIFGRHPVLMLKGRLKFLNRHDMRYELIRGYVGYCDNGEQFTRVIREVISGEGLVMSKSITDRRLTRLWEECIQLNDKRLVDDKVAAMLSTSAPFNSAVVLVNEKRPIELLREMWQQWGYVVK